MKHRYLVLLCAVGLVTAAPYLTRATNIHLAQEDAFGERETGDDQPAVIQTPATATSSPATVAPVTTSSSTITTTSSNTTSTPPTTTGSTTADGNTLTTTPTSSAVSSDFPWAWIVSRATGIASYILLALLSLTGMLMTTGILYRLMSPAAAWSLHRAIGSVLLFSVLAHIGSLLADHFINLSLIDMLVPFASKYQPVWMALGTIGFYILLFVLASSLYTLTSHARFWRTVHFFAFPMFILVFLHSFFIGTDTQRWWMVAIYWGTGGITLAGVAYRVWWKYRQPAV